MIRSTAPSTRGRARRLGSLLLVFALLSAFVGPLPAVAAWAPSTVTETEPNDTWETADPMSADGTIMCAEYNTIDDDDWFSVPLVGGTTYVFETGPDLEALNVNLDTYLYVYDTDGLTQVGIDDDGGVMNFSKITYTPAISGTYFVMSRPFGYSYTGAYGVRVRPQVDPGTGAAAIEGHVTDGTDPLEGVTVTDYLVDPWFYQLDSSYWVEGPSTTTDADGSYSLDVVEGFHMVRFEYPGYFVEYFDGQYNEYMADTVEVDADATVSDVDAALELIPPMLSRVTETTRVSLDAEGQQGVDEGESYRGSRTPVISADGKFVVFYSGNAFVEEDDNAERDWYRKNLETGAIELVSADSEGAVSGYTAENSSIDADDGTAGISGDGRYVVFDSYSNTLSSTDTNGRKDVFMRDMVDGTTVRVSENADGSDGYVEGDGYSYYGSRSPVISRDGRYVVFYTGNAFVEEDTNGYKDWYRKDMTTGEFELVSVATDGTQTDDDGDDDRDRAAISADGRYVAFDSWADSLLDEGADTNGYRDVFLRDMTDRTTVLVSTDASGDGGSANNYGSRTPAISADGRYVVFISGNDFVPEDGNDNDTDWYRKDMTTGALTLVSVNPVGISGNDGMWENEGKASISDDGRYVAFTSEASDLVSDDTNDEADVFLRDIVAGETSIVSVSSEHELSNGWQQNCSMSSDGSIIAYDSWSDNLVPDDTNGCADIFVSSFGERDLTETPLEGTDRYGTAIDVSQDTFPDGADAVVIATGENWPDALGGSALAGLLDGPVLLSRKDALPAEVADEIGRLDATEAYVLGDYRALSNAVYNALVVELGPDNVHRIGGVNRYDTANLVAAEVVDMLGEDYDGTAFVATGLNFADALAASPLAAANGWPVYLSGMPTISDETIVAMQDAGVTDTILLGGEAAMPEGTSIIILGAGFTAVRIDGADRYETAAKVAEYGVTDAGLDWDGVAIATGEKFPDALSGGVAQGLNGSVLLLTRSTSLSPAAETALEDNAGDIASVRFLGGLPALSQAVRDAVMAVLAP